MSGAAGATTLIGALAAVGAAALLPTRVRDPVRVALAFGLVFSPVLAVGAWLATRETEPGTWLALVPLAILWAILVDLRWGVSARLARRPVGRGPRRPGSGGRGAGARRPSAAASTSAPASSPITAAGDGEP